MEEIAYHCMWISMDETTNAVGHIFANLEVGILSKDQITKPHLLCSKQLDVINNATIYLLWKTLKDTSLLPKSVSTRWGT